MTPQTSQSLSTWGPGPQPPWQSMSEAMHSTLEVGVLALFLQWESSGLGAGGIQSAFFAQGWLREVCGRG